MKHLTDSAGRRIREGDRVKHPEYGTGIVLEVDGAAVNIWSTITGHVRTFTTPAFLTITHRSGEPIEEISPLVRDANGRVIERGVRGRDSALVSECDVGSVWRTQSGNVWALIQDRAGWPFYVRAEALTVVPDRASTTLTVHHDPDSDPAKLLRDAGMEVES